MASTVAVGVVTPKTAGGDDDLARLKRMVDDARRDPDSNRIQQELDRDYYDGNQLTPEMRATLRARKQPEIVRNHIKNAVNGVVGVVDSNKTDPRAYPREPGAEDAADVASDVLRYVADMAHFSSVKVDCLENGLIEGAYAVIIECGPDQDPAITQIRAEEFFYDPRSRRPDFKDGRYMGLAKWMYADVIAATYSAHTPEGLLDIASVSEMANGLGSGETTWTDRPDDGGFNWVDKALKRVLVVEIYYQDAGNWMRAVFCAAGFLEPPAPSAYHDDKGVPRNPIVAQSAYVDRRNNRYGIVRDMRGPQDGVNMMASRALHAANSRRIQQKDSMAPPVDVEVARREAARPDGVMPPGWEATPNTDIVSANVEFMNELKDEISRLSPNPAIVGRGTSDASGRAINIRQQAGLVELARVLGRFSDWELRVYRAIWHSVRQFWRAPKYVRTLQDEGAYRMAMVNKPVSPGVPVMDPQTGQPAVDPQTGQPQWAQPPQVENNVAEMDVDIIVDTVPDTPNLEAEVVSELFRLIGSNPLYAQQVPFTAAIKMSQLPRKRELLDMLEQAQQQNAPAQQAQQQLAQAGAQAKVRKDNAQADHQDALANRARVDAAIAPIEAHTALADHQADLGATLDKTAIAKAEHGLEVARFLTAAHASGPFMTGSNVPTTINGRVEGRAS